MQEKNIILIGMPSSGKTTVGKLLGETYNLKYIDTDELILKSENRELKDIVENDGLERFLQIQDDVVCNIKDEGIVISTGGGIIHSKLAIEHIKSAGVVFFLKTDYSEIVKRLSNDRKLARKSEQSYLDVFEERQPLYRKYAHCVVDCNGKLPSEITKYVYENFKTNNIY